jgi:hypothetical protein
MDELDVELVQGWNGMQAGHRLRPPLGQALLMIDLGFAKRLDDAGNSYQNSDATSKRASIDQTGKKAIGATGGGRRPR